MSEHFKTLRSLGSLSAVPDAGVEWLTAHVEERAFAVTELLIRQGDSTRECYFIVDGEAEVRRDGSVLCVSGPGEPEGELGLFLRSPRSATTTARTPLSTLVLSPEPWDRLCQDAPELATEIRVELCRHLARRFGLPAFAGVTLE